MPITKHISAYNYIIACYKSFIKCLYSGYKCLIELKCPKNIYLHSAAFQLKREQIGAADPAKAQRGAGGGGDDMDLKQMH